MRQRCPDRFSLRRSWRRAMAGDGSPGESTGQDGRARSGGLAAASASLALSAALSCGGQGAGSHDNPLPGSTQGSIVQSGVTGLSGVAWSGSIFLAVGTANLAATLLRSTDATHWLAQSPSLLLGEMHRVIWDGTRFVATDPAGNVYDSADGTSFTQIGRTAPFEGLVWTGSQYVGAGTAGIYTSSDAATWTLRHATAQGTSVDAVAWSGTILVVVGSNGTVLTSADGASWTTVSPVTADFLSSVVWSGSKFLAVGTDASMGTGQVTIESADGLHWTTDAPAPVAQGHLAWSKPLGLF